MLVQAVMVAAMLMPCAFAAPGSAGREGNVSVAPKAYYAQQHCEPDCPEILAEQPAPPSEPPRNVNWPTCIVLVIIAVLLGFLIGQASATPSPSKAAAGTAIDTTAGPWITRASNAENLAAQVMLEGQRNDIRSAVQGLLPAAPTPSSSVPFLLLVTAILIGFAVFLAL
jgi:hypothetical protein